MKVILIKDAETSTSKILENLFSNQENLKFFSIYTSQLIDFSIEEFSDSCVILCRLGVPFYKDIYLNLVKCLDNYIYFIDDNFWELNKYNPKIIASESLDCVDYLVGNASLVIASTKLLQDYIKERFNKSTIFIENGFDFQLINEIENLPIREDSKFIVGYAGSRRLGLDSFIEELVHSVLQNSQNIEFEFIGCEYEKLKNIPRVRFKEPLTSYKDYLNYVGRRKWDLAIAPLESEEYVRYKTDNKFREYSALSIPGIYSNIEPYNQIIINSKNGFVRDLSVDSWSKTIIELSGRATHLSFVAFKARKDVADRNDVDKIIPIWFGCFERYKALVLSLDSLDSSRKVIKLSFSQRAKLKFDMLCFYTKVFTIVKENEGVGVAMLKSIRFIFRRRFRF